MVNSKQRNSNYNLSGNSSIDSHWSQYSNSYQENSLRTDFVVLIFSEGLSSI